MSARWPFAAQSRHLPATLLVLECACPSV
ncbi:hypothetical protein HU200_023476 [Digitaria exilis]|uniref:Uncharacterized protein n=1 Tax=Digitaria exilis TaxID=1010633 RepID=A0A835EUH5_9POAL|nr:hypothetical protein HU200_023476 [Digitaria exilis]